TTLESPSGTDLPFEWQEGSLFAIPLNVPHRFYAHGEDVRLVAFTTAPLVFDLYHTADFVYETNHWFSDRFDGTPDFIKKDVRVERQVQNLLGAFSNRYWETNFVADARATLPDEISEEKHSLRFILFELAGNS